MAPRILAVVGKRTCSLMVAAAAAAAQLLRCPLCSPHAPQGREGCSLQGNNKWRYGWA